MQEFVRISPRHQVHQELPFANVVAVLLLAKTIVDGLVKPEQGVAFSGRAGGVIG
jgi:hypothetical protein